MTKREKILGWLFGSLFVVIIGTSIVVSGTRKISDMRAQSSRLSERVEELETLIETRAQWEQRSEWISENTPDFPTAGQASSALISAVDAVSSQIGVVVEGKELIELRGDAESDEEEAVDEFFDSAGLKVSVTGNEESIMKWVHALQQPSTFTGVREISLELDPNGAGLRCEAEVRLWYAAAE